MIGLKFIWCFRIADYDRVDSAADDREEGRAHTKFDNESNDERHAHCPPVAATLDCTREYRQNADEDRDPQTNHE